MMPIRDMVIFPYMMTPFVVGRESSVRALEEALTGDRKIFLATQHDASIDEPKAKDIYQVGSICNIVQSVKMPDGNVKVLVEGVERAKSVEVTDRDGFFVATVRTGKSQLRDDARCRAVDAARYYAVRELRQAAAVAQLRNHHRQRADGRARQTVRHDCSQFADRHRRKARAARHLRSRGAAGPPRRCARCRNRKARPRSQHPVARKAPDGARAKRVLPQRKDQGHPKGTGPRREERVRRAAQED